MTNNRVGLMIGRFQPLHIGHLKSINQMIQDCDTAIVCVGSTQKSREEHDPWTVEERIQMIKNLYGAYSSKGEYLGCRVKIVPLADLGASSARPGDWIDYVFEKLGKLDMEEPTDYFTGSFQDSVWYKDYFSPEWKILEEKTSAELVKNHSSFITDADGIVRRLHILDRQTSPMISATEIRGFLSLRNDGWKEWVPAVNHDLVGYNYPERFKIPIK